VRPTIAKQKRKRAEEGEEHDKKKGSMSHEKGGVVGQN